MINLLQVIAPITVGGAENVLLTLNNWIDKSRFTLSFCIFINPQRPKNEFYKRLLEHKCDVSIIYLDKRIDFLYILELIRIIRQKKIHIIHTHGYLSDIFGIVASKVSRKPIISTAHGWTFSTRRVRIYEFVQRKSARFFDGVIAVSQQIQNVLVQNKVKKKRIRTVSNTIDFRRFSSLNNPGKSESKTGCGLDGPALGVIGRLSKEKGHIVLLKAVSLVRKHYPNLKLFVIGEGDQEDRLRAFIKAEKIEDNVVFLGFQKDVCRFYPLFDIFILPSLTEGIPLVLLEAMFFKTPIIASNVGGIPELISNGYNGVLVPPEQQEILAANILMLLQDRQYALKIAENGYEYLQKNHDPRIWARKIADIYQTVYDKKMI
ncbi:MAG: glycosyltransferase [Desulfobacterales bacterium]|nr:glycosyltransferase [Desulfobacterales bacterium]